MLDKTAIDDTATCENPKQSPIGIPQVIVNGEVAVDNERCTRVLASRRCLDDAPGGGGKRSHCAGEARTRLS